jgi:cell division septum initiation protein DivIVA
MTKSPNLTDAVANALQAIQAIADTTGAIDHSLRAAQTEAELARIDADRGAHEKDEALTKLDEAEQRLIDAAKEAAERIAKLEATNALLARREKEASDEHTRLRAIVTKQNTERAHR